ncbi:hypothetical protein ACFSKL_09860 [Belliella marina]|uniref:FAS1 domain-containing protein n=1 Tax=Belliella marina TaxID=1644146 RepID=A0ABW4VNJ5_9BACT
MKHLFTLFFLVFGFNVVPFAQQNIEWSPEVVLELSDFQSKRTRIDPTVDSYLIQTGSKVDFLVSMSNAEFLFTKNFNSKVTAIFSPNASLIIAPNENVANSLLNFARYHFDLTELYARKFRKMLFENKGAFSSINFIMPLYDNVQEELVARSGEAGDVSGLGMDGAELEKLHLAVKLELTDYEDFCKTCKPPKDKKRK